MTSRASQVTTSTGVHKSARELADQLRSIADTLDLPTLAGAATSLHPRGDEPRLPPVLVTSESTDYLAQVRKIIEARKLRDLHFGADYFAEPAWDILLDLFEARLVGQARCMKSVCCAARTPLTTALRHVERLVLGGLVEKAFDPTDRRRTIISLTPSALKLMARYFEKLS